MSIGLETLKHLGFVEGLGSGACLCLQSVRLSGRLGVRSKLLDKIGHWSSRGCSRCKLYRV